MSRPLGITIIERTPGLFRLRVRVPGEGRSIYRHVRGVRADADRAAAAWRDELAIKGAPPVSPATRLAAWIETLIASRTDLEARTIERYREMARLHLAPLGTRPLHRITAADGLAWQTLLLRRLSPATVRHAYALVHHALREAARLNVIPADPWAGVRRVKPKARVRSVIPPDRFRAVANAGAGKVNHLLRLALATGARRGEILAATWADVDFNAGTLAIHRSLELLADGSVSIKPPKTATGARVIALPLDTIALLTEMRRQAASDAIRAGVPIRTCPILPGDAPGEFWHPRAASKAAARALRKAGLGDTLHGLRHAHATALLAARVNPRAVQQRLGHARVEITLGLYGHVLPGDDAAAAAVINAATAS